MFADGADFEYHELAPYALNLLPELLHLGAALHIDGLVLLAGLDVQGLHLRQHLHPDTVHYVVDVAATGAELLVDGR